jgi:hypothetical protein
LHVWIFKPVVLPFFLGFSSTTDFSTEIQGDLKYFFFAAVCFVIMVCSRCNHNKKLGNLWSLAVADGNVSTYILISNASASTTLVEIPNAKGTKPIYSLSSACHKSPFYQAVAQSTLK